MLLSLRVPSSVHITLGIHVWHIMPAPLRAWISLGLRGTMGSLWITFLSLGLHPGPFFFFSFSSKIGLLTDLGIWSYGKKGAFREDPGM